MEEINNNNNFNNINNIYKKISQTKKHKSSSPDITRLNPLKKNSKTNFVSLVNNLSSDIKLFYYSTKNCLNQGKNPIYNTKFSSNQIFDLIEKNLNEFIFKAKEIFKRMKYIQKINIIQQEMNKSNPNTDLNSNYENKNNFIEDDNYINNLINKSKNKLNNKISTSPKINNYFKKSNFIDSDNDMIKSLNNSSKDMRLINKYDCYYNIEDNDNHGRHSENKIIYNKYNNNMKRNNNKSVINLRKKILVDKKQDNSSLGSQGLSNSQIFTNINNNINNSNINGNNNEIFEHLNIIVNLLKEMKSIKGNIFIKSLEAQKHKNILNKMYNEFSKLIKYIFKNNNIINISNNLLDLSTDNKIQNNSSYNFTFNNKNNDNQNENNNDNIKTDYYNKEIKYRDLIIQQLKTKQNNNEKQNFILLKKRCIELQKEKEIIISKNNELKKKIIILEQEFKKISEKNIHPQIPIFLKQNFFFQYLSKEDYIGIKAQKLLDELNKEIKEKNEAIEKINIELNTYKEKDIKIKEEKDILNEEINKLNQEKNELNKENNNIKEKILMLQKEIENINKQNNEYLNENKLLKENNEQTNQNIEKYKKIISYQEEEIKNLKNNSNEININNYNIHESNIKTESELKKVNKSSLNNNNINLEEKKNKKRNTNSKINDYQIEQDKIYLKYELLKNDYDKLNNTLIQKQKLLDNYSKISSETASKTNIDEQILELMDKHKKEIEELTKNYNKSIIKLKMNQPSPYSPETHRILIDKRYAKYDLKWYLITMTTEQEKNYENTFWVSEMEMKPLLPQFNDFKTEVEIEDEKFENLYKMQEKWIKQINENEKLIELLKGKLEEYEGNNTESK